MFEKLIYSRLVSFLQKHSVIAEVGICLEKNYLDKKGLHVRRSPNFDPNSDKKQKKGQNDNGLILGRVQVMPYYSAEYSKSTRHNSKPKHNMALKTTNLLLMLT